MFLALKEIKKEKFRSGLIISMVALIAYLIFILSSLALGLARENTDAINSWDAKRIALNSNANVDIRQSVLTENQITNLSDTEATISESSIVSKSSEHKDIPAVFMGINDNQFIYKNLKIDAGKNFMANDEVVADYSFKDKGYKVGDTIKFNDLTTNFKIVGFTKGAKINVAPIIYGNTSVWGDLRGNFPGTAASAVVSQDKSYKNPNKGITTYTKDKVIQKLPGYSAQNITFLMMIGFLMVISLIIIGVFLYILTLQKLPNYAVLRVQGIPRKVLVKTTIAQSVLLVTIGIVIGVGLTAITAVSLPPVVPMAFDIPVLSAVAAGLLVMSVIGGLIPIRTVLKVDPVSVIGGN